MKETKKEAEQLLAELRADEYKKYDDGWQGRAVAVLNNWYIEDGRNDDEIYDTAGEVWDDIVKYNLENRGWVGLKYLLADVGNLADWARLDAYGNGEEITGDDLAGLLADLVEEIEDDEEEE